MNKKLKDEAIDTLFKAILTLKTCDECYDFFEDLCTISEIKAMAQRFQVAGMLENKEIYSEIEEKTGASSATISRINKCLQYGADGYKIALSRLGASSEEKK